MEEKKVKKNVFFYCINFFFSLNYYKRFVFFISIQMLYFQAFIVNQKRK